jgi:hypothetical protein
MPPLSPQQLQDIVDRFGEDPAGWPADYRAEARELIDICAEAKAIIAQAKLLRVLLQEMGPLAPACFSDQIIALAMELDPPYDEYMSLPN